MWWSEHGIACEPWSQDEATRRLPHLAQLISNQPNVEFWYVPDDCRVRNPRHLAALIAACRKLCVDLFEQTRVVGFERSNHRIERIRVEGVGIDSSLVHEEEAKPSHIAGERVCITAGAWSVKMLEELGITTGILPVRGQMVLYRCKEPPFSMILNEGHRYLVPRDDGHVLAGSCEEEVGYDCQTTPSMIAELRSWAETICPDLASTPVAAQWAGLRPGSFDSFPYLGTLPSIENAYIASGHFRHGLHWSTATALLMRELMSGSPTSMELAPFRVQRGYSSGSFTIVSDSSGQPR
jgi:glycine oxidase